MHFATLRPAVRHGTLLVTLLALCSCEFFAPKPVPAPEPVKKAHDTTDFIQSLSIAKLVLENGGSAKDVSAELKAMESYSAVKRKKTPVLTVLALDYSAPAVKGTQRLLAPLGKDGKDKGSLTKLLRRMEPYKPTLSEIRVFSVPVKPAVMTFGKRDAGQVLQHINDRQKALLAGAGNPPALEAARIHVTLLEYFIANQQKDAAYLCADTAKRQLGKAVQQKGHEQEANALSLELGKLEGRLREAMPY